jgi:signal transduction histidine kinase
MWREYVAIAAFAIAFVESTTEKEMQQGILLVLSNLLSNALKYASDNATINIELKNGKFLFPNIVKTILNSVGIVMQCFFEN